MKGVRLEAVVLGGCGGGDVDDGDLPSPTRSFLEGYCLRLRDGRCLP